MPVMEDIFANIETTVMVNDSLQAKIEGLRDIVWELKSKENKVIKEKIRNIFRDY